jgi:hypothetical protein
VTKPIWGVPPPLGDDRRGAIEHMPWALRNVPLCRSFGSITHAVHWHMVRGVHGAGRMGSSRTRARPWSWYVVGPRRDPSALKYASGGTRPHSLRAFLDALGELLVRYAGRKAIWNLGHALSFRRTALSALSVAASSAACLSGVASERAGFGKRPS